MAKANTFGVLFFIRTSREKEGRVPLMLRITVNGRREQIYLHKRILKKLWESKTQRLKGSSEDARQVNDLLRKTEFKINSIYHELEGSGQNITASLIKDSFLGKTKKSNTFVSLFQYHNVNEESKLIPATLNHYKSSQSHILKFVKEHYGLGDLPLSKLDYEFITSYESYLRKHIVPERGTKLSTNTVMKHIQRLKKMISMSRSLGWLDKDPFLGYKYSFVKTDRSFLSELELESLVEYDFKSKRLNFVKDLYVFSCYTGMAYKDVMNLTPDNLELGIDKELWISFNRQKTKNKVRIPVLPNALTIIERYVNEPQSQINKTVFPQISNQKVNSYLKEIGEILGFNKSLTHHTARHTFATTVTLSNGMPIETVSKLLGHTKIATTQIYARVLDNKISNDMNELKNKLHGFKGNKKAL
ncbi:site-specific integrase [Flavobacteriaceae bacterium]|nr:site-specific integrase [Flavobacteriaceae bacterium]